MTFTVIDQAEARDAPGAAPDLAALVYVYM